MLWSCTLEWINVLIKRMTLQFSKGKEWKRSEKFSLTETRKNNRDEVRGRDCLTMDDEQREGKEEGDKVPLTA